MISLGLTIRCECWWNGDHSSMTVSGEGKTNFHEKTTEISKSTTKEATILLLEFAGSCVGLI